VSQRASGQAGGAQRIGPSWSCTCRCGSSEVAAGWPQRRAAAGAHAAPVASERPPADADRRCARPPGGGARRSCPQSSGQRAAPVPHGAARCSRFGRRRPARSPGHLPPRSTGQAPGPSAEAMRAPLRMWRATSSCSATGGGEHSAYLHLQPGLSLATGARGARRPAARALRQQGKLARAAPASCSSRTAPIRCAPPACPLASLTSPSELGHLGAACPPAAAAAGAARGAARRSAAPAS